MKKSYFRPFEKYKMMSTPLKAGAWYLISNILHKGISFFIVPVYVRLLSTAEYGQYTVFQSWRDVLIIFVTLNLYSGVFTKAMVDYEDDRDRYTSSMQGLTSLFVLGWFVIYALNYKFISLVFDLNFITLLLLFAYFLVQPSFLFWSVRQRVEYKYKRLMIITLVISLLIPTVSIFLLILTDLRESAVILGFLCVRISFGLYFYIRQFIKGSCFFHKKYWEHALKFNIPIIPHYLSLIVLSQVDRIMIKEMRGPQYAGIYSFAYSIAMLMMILISAINSSLVPWTYKNLKTEQYSQISKVSSKLCISIGILTFGAILLSPELVKILGTKDYYEAIWIIPAVSLSAYFIFCYGLFASVEFYFSQTKNVMIASIVAAILNIALNLVFIKLFGFIAAGYTTLLCYIVLMIMHYLGMKKICRDRLGGIYIFNEKLIAVLSLMLLGLLSLILFVYRYTLIRFGLILLIGIGVFWFRKQIITLLKEIKS